MKPKLDRIGYYSNGTKSTIYETVNYVGLTPCWCQANTKLSNFFILILLTPSSVTRSYLYNAKYRLLNQSIGKIFDYFFNR